MHSNLGGGIAVVFGTRPEIIKLGPVIEALGDRAVVVYTGQHFSRNMSQVFFAEIGIRAPDIELGIGGETRAVQIARTTESLAARFEKERPTAVVVQGDTNSTVGAALAANACELPLVHVEAGLRSHDRAMPEEHNRIIADHLADLLLPPTAGSAANLRAESINRPTHITGNTVVDVAARLVPSEEQTDVILRTHGLRRDGYHLSTFHRPENVDDTAMLSTIFRQLSHLDLPVVLPLHPRTHRRIQDAGGAIDTDGILIIDPIGYIDFLGLARAARCLVTDSGGVQEEASILGKPVAVVRNSTERPEILGTFGELVPDRTALGDALRALTAPERMQLIANTPSPYGDGTAGRRCVDAMRSEGLFGEDL